MKILIAGNGKVGASLARQLSAEGHDLTLVDSNQKVLERCVEQYDVMGVQGNCASRAILLQAGADEADLLIAVTNADEVNLLCCMTAHGLNPRLHTIARIRNPDYTDQIYDMRDLFALSMSVNPERRAAAEIERLLKFPGFLKRDTFAKGRVEIVEFRIAPESKLCDIPLKEMGKTVQCRVLVCTVLRDGKAIAPDGNFILRAGDRLFVTAPTNTLEILLKNLGIITRKVKRVMLCGGGRISYYLAQQLLKSGMEVQIVEQDYDRCVKLSSLLPTACIIHGDASSRTLLESEGVADCDALISLTDLDEMNMVISLYANSIGIGQIVTKLGHVENGGIISTLPLGSVVCPKELCCNNIVRYVRAMQNQTGAAIAVHSIADGNAEAVEFLADETTLHCGEPLKTLRFRKNVLVACITHGAKTEIPNGDSTFSKGDSLVIISSRSEVLHQLNDIFE